MTRDISSFPNYFFLYYPLCFPPAQPRQWLYWVLKHGTFLAQRWEADDEGVNLYHCADEGRGFFVEVGVD